MAQILATTVAGIDDLRSSITGVQLDEELSDLMRYQRAYEASARVMSAADEMLDTLINRTGVVGR
jgi:flagellar hook-associated protein 1 FlgK